MNFVPRKRKTFKKKLKVRSMRWLKVLRLLFFLKVHV